MVKQLRIPLIMALAVIFAACATLGIPKAETFNQKVAQGYIAVTAVVDSAATLFTAGKLSEADKNNVADLAQGLKEGLDIARSIHASDPVAGDARLQAVMTGLTALSAYLDSRKQK